MSVIKSKGRYLLYYQSYRCLLLIYLCSLVKLFLFQYLGKSSNDTPGLSPRPRSARPLPQAPTDSRSAYQEFLKSHRKSNSPEKSDEKQPLFQHTEGSQSKNSIPEDTDDLEIEDVTENDE